MARPKKETTGSEISFNNPATIRARVTFTEDVLGSMPSSPDILADYIASKSPDASTIEEEIEAIGEEAVADGRRTVFPRDENGNPFIYDYQVKGFFKEACKILRNCPGSVASGIKAYVKAIDGLVFPAPRKILYHINPNAKMGVCTRPLRASTPMGERVSIASSESIPAGSWIEFDVVCLTGDAYDLVIEALDYGRLKGLSQWRNSGAGRFTWEMIE